MNLFGTYAGVVKENRDPLKMGRVKVLVPAVYGVADATVGLENIPWALPAGRPLGATDRSGGIDWVPNIDDQVFVRFLDGVPEQPIWEWGNQTIDQAKNAPVHDYDKTTKRPFRAALTRYGHVLEINETSLIITTANGYSVILNDSKTKQGSIVARSPSNHQVEIDDLAQTLEARSASGQLVQIDDLAVAINIIANDDVNIQANDSVDTSCARVKTLGRESVDVQSKVSAKIAVSDCRVQLTATGMVITAPSSIELSAGASKLQITPAGFNFTQG